MEIDIILRPACRLVSSVFGIAGLCMQAYNAKKKKSPSRFETTQKVGHSQNLQRVLRPTNIEKATNEFFNEEILKQRNVHRKASVIAYSNDSLH